MIFGLSFLSNIKSILTYKNIHCQSSSYVINGRHDKWVVKQTDQRFYTLHLKKSLRDSYSMNKSSNINYRSLIQTLSTTKFAFLSISMYPAMSSCLSTNLSAIYPQYHTTRRIVIPLPLLARFKRFP